MSNVHQSVVDLVRARIGTTLKDKWHIDALLGIGGMAAVYSATHRTGSRVAIKMLHPQLSLNDVVRKRFSREGYVANQITHPGVARVLDDDVTEDGAAFLVMELLEGETAAERADRNGGRLPMHEVAFIGEGVADVLAAAHASGIIHRDIKPENVFITREGRVVVLDFGIARVADASGISDAGTRTGTMMGTPAFMPPEQARGRANEMDATSDVWALGATLFWLLSGRIVHPAETPNEQLVAAATLPAPSLARVAPEVPTPLVAVIDQALQFAKENRFPDAVALRSALHDAIVEISWGPDAAPGILVGPAAAPSGPASASRLEVRSSLATVSEGGRGPTFGPVEVGGKGGHRATKLIVAVSVGALAVVVALAGVLLPRRGGHSVAASAPAPPRSSLELPAPAPPSPVTPPPPAATAMASAPAALTASASPIASASASPAASAQHHLGSPPPTHGKKSWLDRRK